MTKFNLQNLMKKLRTRQHIIEDLGFNHVERQVLLAGCTLHRMFPDYGYDGYIHLYNDRGEYTNGLIKFQLKSTDTLKSVGEQYAVDLSNRDLELWLLSVEPVILFLYSADSDVAYFVELGKYFEENRATLKDVRKFVRVYLPASNVFTDSMMEQWRADLNFR